MCTLPHSTVLFSTTRGKETHPVPANLLRAQPIWIRSSVIYLVSPSKLSTPRLNLLKFNKISLCENPKILRKGLKILIWDKLNWPQPFLPFPHHTIIRSHCISNHTGNGSHMKNTRVTWEHSQGPATELATEECYHFIQTTSSHPTWILRSTLATLYYWSVVQSGPSIFRIQVYNSLTSVYKFLHL